jgi:lysophospholipase L1-like esterase
LPYWPKKVEKFRNRFRNTLKDAYLTSERQQHIFEKLVAEFYADGIQPIFINTPEYGSTVADYRKIRSIEYLDSFAKKNKIPFLNYNLERRTPISDDKALFADWGHLNEQGSLVFSKILYHDLDSLLRNYP